MSTLSDALAAMDKATTGPWIAKLCLGGSYVIDNTLPENKGLVRNIAEVSGHLSTSKDAALIAAAPDMAAWIKKALPWVEIRAERLRTLLILARAEKDEAYVELIADASEELAALDALLAEAKGEGKC